MTDAPLPRSRSPRPPRSARREIVVVVDASLEPAEAAILCAQVALRLADPSVDRLACDARAIDRPDLQAVDTLARLALAARRSGVSVQVRQAGGELRAWLAFVGLADILPCDPIEGRGEGLNLGSSVAESSG
jgi:hypothetical protein